jgi:subtilisin family serine protease
MLLVFSLGFLLVSPAMAANPHQDRYIVSFLDSGKGKSALRSAGASILLDLPDREIAAVRIPARALKGLRKNPSIEYIEKDVLRHPMAQTTPWGVPTALGPDWDLVTGVDPAQRKICIIDSGYAQGHEDLPGPGNVDGTNVSGSGNWFEDTCYHGTHVAGTIAAVNNGVGVVGVAGGTAGLHIIKVFDGASCAWAYSSSLIAALDECIAVGSNIVSMSLGGTFKSRSEQRAFGDAANQGVLSIAAAGNGGNTRNSYPASYDSVMSVAAVDSALDVASFSQQNDQVEIAAPGVAVRSTVGMGDGLEESLSVGGASYEATGMDGSFKDSRSGTLFHCSGFGEAGDCAGAAGKVCLISRGSISFAEKVQECQIQGGVAAVIYNNEPALFSGTLGGADTGIPSVGISGDDGADLLTKIGQSATVTVELGNYAFYDGTSMATPHVSAVAALVWSKDTNCTDDDVRAALTATALDLPPFGRDNATGFGLVQADAAVAALSCDGGGGGGGGGGGCGDLLAKGASCSSDSQCCSNSCKGKSGSKTCK